MASGIPKTQRRSIERCEMTNKAKVIKKDLALTVSVTGTFIVYETREYKITRLIQYDAKDLSEYKDEDELIAEQFSDDFEREAEKKFRDEWESGKITTSDELELEEVEADIND
jgi:hypothetical protein